ncbi:MAG TPA: tRNA (adenosine(37)-N6)-dimethylallyltransferase MiaA [Anaerolineales bacterium]|nr:tRNA (adenosine(37)-N6)-dimethylallyltransferase MiaA [Anaerolineales bacterium]HNN14612.1 tRNA (adenosine(37)-N6)-dimethylallyltransferase MiaA [Anaerolineales bacterium]HNO32564.1 tRNA (adenosine(37)-N6)-dimethylallyltransferase MiaA [Anaerolineales bacterium]
MDRFPLILIVGPTAVGKTDLAIRLASNLNGEIISADSRLFYRGMDIGTAKPTANEMKRVPHYLIDIVDPSETLSLALFQDLARKTVQEVHMRNHLPFLVGGTGQYIRAVTDGWTPPEVKPDESMRKVLEKLAEEKGKQWLYEKLKILDPNSAQNIDLRNVRRTIRALEVIFATGRRFSEQRGQGDSPYRLITIGLIRPREELYQRVDERIDTMFASGLLDEAKRLLNAGYSPTLPSMSAIGYRECVSVIEGRMTVEQAKAEMKRITRVFVRRQANWFKESDPNIKWFNPAQEGVDQQIEQHIRNSIASEVL